MVQIRHYLFLVLKNVKTVGLEGCFVSRFLCRQGVVIDIHEEESWTHRRCAERAREETSSAKVRVTYIVSTRI